MHLVCYKGRMTERLARAAAAHPWRAIGAWIAAIVVAFVLVGAFLAGGLTSDATVTNNPESLRAERLREPLVHRSAGETTELVVIRNEDLAADDPAFRAEFDRLSGELADTGAAVLVVSPYDGEGLISEDGHARARPDPARLRRGGDGRRT